jgi:hypothetical protein
MSNLTSSDSIGDLVLVGVDGSESGLPRPAARAGLRAEAERVLSRAQDVARSW